MPLCGFNQKMLDSIDKFHKGLVESIVKKESLGSKEQK